MNEPNGDGWDKWRIAVLEKLEDLQTRQNDADRKREEGQVRYFETVADIKSEIAVLKTKAGIWGGVAGMVAAVAATLGIGAVK